MGPAEPVGQKCSLGLGVGWVGGGWGVCFLPLYRPEMSYILIVSVSLVFKNVLFFSGIVSAIKFAV